jgi:hypothetical protein
VVLERLHMTTTTDDSQRCIMMRDVVIAPKDAPVIVQNCVLQNGRHACCLEGRDRENIQLPADTGHVVIRNNDMVGCSSAVVLTGAVHRVHIVGNRIRNSKWTAIDFEDFRPGVDDILVANNTMLQNNMALRIWEGDSKGQACFKCRNIRFQNNLVFKSRSELDMFFLNYPRGKTEEAWPGDLVGLLNSPEWRLSHNWREIDLNDAAAQYPRIWIPGRPEDHLKTPINVLSRTPGDPNFLRPPKNSPLAWSGAGGHGVPSARVASLMGQAAGLANPWMAGAALAQPINQPDLSLPAYVGAVPPEGVEPWDWQKTWTALTR